MSDHMTPADARKALAKARHTQLESEVLQQVRQYLQMRSWLVVRMQQNMGSHKGIADLYCVRDGRSVWLEVKTMKGKQSEHQVKFQAAIESHGEEYRIARCLEDAMDIDREREPAAQAGRMGGME